MQKILFAFFLSSLSITIFSASMGKWTELDPKVEGSILGMAYGNNTWVAVGNKEGNKGLEDYIATSSDGGKTWKEHAPGIKRQFNGITFQNGRFIAVCKAPDEGSGAKIWISDTDGKSWKYRDTDSAGNYLAEGLHAVAGNGSNMLVAVGGGWSGKMTISNDNGTSWNVKELQGVSKLYGIAYGDGVWIACGTGEPIRSSNPTETWQKIDGGPSGNSVAYGNGIFVMASSNGLYWSNDKGATWKACVPSEEFKSESFGKGRGVAFGDGYFAASFENDGIWMSETGIAWQKWTAPGNNPWYYCIAFGNRIFMAGGDQSSGGKYPAIVAKSPPWFRAKIGSTRDYPYAVFDFEDSLPKKIGLPEYRVNTTSLNLILEGTLFYMRTLGVPVNMKLVYCSSPIKNDSKSIGLFGKNWHFAYETTVGQFGPEAQLITTGGRSLTFTTPDGQDLDTATPTNPIVLVPPPGVFDTLTFYGNGERFEYYEKNTKNIYTYATAIDYIWHLNSIKDRNGNVVTFDVDKSNGQIKKITDSSGRTINLSYDETKNLCTEFTVPDGRTVSFSYDENKNLVGIKDMAGYSASYQYDELGFLTQMNTAGRINKFSYLDRPGSEENNSGTKQADDGKDKILVSVTNYQGKTTSYELLEDSMGVQRTDPLGNKTTFSFNDGQTTQVKDPLDKIRSIEYNGLKLPASYTNANSAKTKYSYDNRGNIVTITDALGNKTTLNYDDKDNMISKTDPLGNTWSYSYDANSNLTGTTTPLNYSTEASYFSNGRLKTFTDANGKKTSFTYDGYGNIASITDPIGNIISFTYGTAGLRCSNITDQSGNNKEISYDNNDRVLKVIYSSVPDSPSKINTFNAFGQISFTDELGNITKIERNEFGYLTSITDPLGFSVSTDYDSDNNPIKNVDALGNTTLKTYDKNGRLLTETNPLNKTSSRTYDDDGNLISITDLIKGTTSFSYDLNNRLITTTYPMGETISTERDALGRPSIVTNARGQKISYTYDSDGRIIERKMEEQKETFTYDANGNLIQRKDAWGTTTFNYNDINRLISTSYPSGKTASFTYDPNGRISTITYPGNLVVSYIYDNFNRLPIPNRFSSAPTSQLYGMAEKASYVKTMSISLNDTPLGTVNFIYDKAANITKIIRFNGTTTDFTYDAKQQLTSITHSNNSSGLQLSISYKFDGASNIISEDYNGPEYFPLPELPSGDKIKYNKASQILKASKNSFKYDADGNLEKIGENIFSATYTADNRPISITTDSGTINYTYDSEGNRVKRVENTTETQYHYDATKKLLFTTDKNGNLKNRYIYANSMLFAFIDSSNNINFYHTDIRGSVAFITDNSGNAVVKYAYDPYGKTFASKEYDNPFTFAGAYGVMLENNGLLYMQNRFYDPTTGRFLQRDPVGFEGGLNLYAYAGSNPINNIDPQGRWFFAIPVGAKIIVALSAMYTAYSIGSSLKGLINTMEEEKQKKEKNVNDFLDSKKDLNERVNAYLDERKRAAKGTMKVSKQGLRLGFDAYTTLLPGIGESSALVGETAAAGAELIQNVAVDQYLDSATSKEEK